VTSSSIARGVIAALNVSGVVRFALKGATNVDDAIAWLRQRRPTHDAAHLRALVDEARAKAAQRANAAR
jgi:hypothetical protein